MSVKKDEPSFDRSPPIAVDLWDGWIGPDSFPLRRPGMNRSSRTTTAV